MSLTPSNFINNNERIKLQKIPRNEHSISRTEISENALKVLYRLTNSGFDAFLVGGSVRDLLLGKHPKDFDITTSAHPEQIKKLFGNARIIGRRFRIVHIRFGKEVIEVATFRANHSAADEETPDAVRSETGIILRDNVYGTVEDDAVRRDFTVNALYYTIKDFAVYDYVNGLKDLLSREIRMIGNPVMRYQEDPVRMLRAIRFAAKLNFKIAEDTAAPIPQMAHLLSQIPTARLFEETLKLFMSGHTLVTFELLHKYQLLPQLFPDTFQYLQNPLYFQFIKQALINTDQRINSDKYVTPAFLFAVFLWPNTKEMMNAFLSDGVPPSLALHQASQIVINRQLSHTALPRRFSTPMKEIWDLQLPLEKRHKKRVVPLIQHKRFRAAFDFLLLREQAGEELGGIGSWWTSFQTANSNEQNTMIAGLQTKNPRNQNRNRKKSSHQ